MIRFPPLSGAGRSAGATLRRILLRSPRLFVRFFSPDDRELGLLGEEIAARHLARRGFRILARRFRTRSGEADLVARSRERLVVCEVKTGRLEPVPRPRGAILPESAVLRWRPGARCDERRLARLFALAKEIAADPAFRPPGSRRAGTPRVDLVEVWLLGRGREFRLQHHENVEKPLSRP